MLKQGAAYVELGQAYYEQQYQSRLVKRLSFQAKKLGFALVELPVNSAS